MTDTPSLNDIIDMAELHEMSDLLGYGLHDMAYIRPNTDSEGGKYAVHAADGTLLTIVEDKEKALGIIMQNDLNPVHVH